MSSNNTRGPNGMTLAEYTEHLLATQAAERAAADQRIVEGFAAVRALQKQKRIWCVPCKAAYSIATPDAAKVCPLCATPW